MKKQIISKDLEIDKILRAILQLTSGHQDATKKVKGGKSDIDAILDSIKMLGESLKKNAATKRKLEESEARARQFLEFLPIGVYVLEANGTPLYANNRSLEILGKGISPDDKLDVLSEIHQGYKAGTNEYYPKEQFPLVRALAGETVHATDIELQKDGKRISIEVWAKPVLGKNKKIEYAIAVFDDVTERTKRYASLVDYKQALDSAAIVAITDQKGRITYVNDKFCEISGYAEEELIGQDHRIINSGHHPKSFFNDLWTTIANGNTWRGEVKNKAKGGTFYWVDTTIIPFLGPNGKPEQYIAIRSDVTDRMLLQEKLINATEIAKKSVQAKNVFLANMSHEIRTPMNAIVGFSDLLTETILDSEQKEYVEAIRMAGGNLLAVVNDILDISKIESGKLELDNAVFQLSNTLNAAKRLLSSAAGEKGLGLKLSLDSEVPEYVIGDASRLTQIMVNLLSNAIKFTETGQVDIGVQVLESDLDLCLIQVNVADTGIGISKKNQERVFERFEQVKSDYGKSQGGTGLGLNITRKLVELFNGKLELISEEGKGSNFIVTIPFTVHKKEKEKELKFTSIHEGITVNKKTTVLVAEDNLLNQKLIGRILANFGVSCDIVENGKLATEQILKKEYDLVIMDLQMPEMDGYAATKYIRNDLKLNIPILAMTAHSLVGEKDKCLAAGMNDYLAKPFKKEALYDIINTLIYQRPAALHAESSITGTTKQNGNGMFDLTDLNQLAGGDENFIKEMVKIFKENIFMDIAATKSAWSDGNLGGVAANGHKMKASFRIMGIDRGGELCSELEYCEEADSVLSLEEIGGRISELEDISRQVIQQLGT